MYLHNNACKRNLTKYKYINYSVLLNKINIKNWTWKMQLNWEIIIIEKTTCFLVSLYDMWYNTCMTKCLMKVQRHRLVSKPLFKLLLCELLRQNRKLAYWKGTRCRECGEKKLRKWNPANIYLFKVNNRNNRKRCEICLKLTIKQQNDVIEVVLVFLLLTLKIFVNFF